MGFPKAEFPIECALASHDERSRMKKIGMIGGLSWVSTAAYYQRLNEIAQQRVGGVTSAHIMLESVNREAYVEYVIRQKNEDAACDMILSAARAVESGGAEFIVISCNDVHRFVPKVAPHLSIPFLHIAEVTAQAIEQQGLKTIALLGVMKTMEGDFYQGILSDHGIDTLVPNPAKRTYVHDKIMDEMVANVFTDETKVGYLDLIQTMHQQGAEGVILGCTEIPLLLNADEISIPSFSTTELHCQAAISQAIAA